MQGVRDSEDVGQGDVMTVVADGDQQHQKETGSGQESVASRQTQAPRNADTGRIKSACAKLMLDIFLYRNV
jgi:hypothetical protein